MSEKQMNYIDLVLLEDKLLREKDALWREWRAAEKAEHESYQNYKYAGDQFFQQKHELWELHQERRKLVLDKYYHDLSPLDAKIKVAKEILAECEQHYIEANEDFVKKQEERDRKKEEFQKALGEWKQAKSKMDHFKVTPPSNKKPT